MTYLIARGSANRRPVRRVDIFRPNAWSNVQVLPPYNVDLTLTPTTQEQIRARSDMIDHTRK
jgi:hypothetical protein